eukprot:TRINITY_DN7324_c0_g1_i3.p1 TRINITY_DN7324_c0_g1~~TRINITY_DN7324_c0_g1_i3.p1  ORF type:complete len:507 (+),score=95.59 TRINITY_DN7324_c0_g1_i3:136-1656(+)
MCIRDRFCTMVALLFPLIVNAIWTCIVSPRLALDAKISGLMFGPCCVAMLMSFMMVRSVILALLAGMFGTTWHRAKHLDSTQSAALSWVLKTVWDRETDCWDFCYYSMFGYLHELRQPLLEGEPLTHTSVIRAVSLLLLSPFIIAVSVFGMSLTFCMTSLGCFFHNWLIWARFWLKTSKDAPFCCPVAWLMVICGPLASGTAILVSAGFGAAVGMVCLVVGMAKCRPQETFTHMQRQLRHFCNNELLNPGVKSLCCVQLPIEQDRSLEPSGTVDGQTPDDTTVTSEAPPTYAESLMHNPVSPGDAPPAYAPSLEVGVIAAATAELGSSKSSDAIWEAFFAKCAHEAGAAVARGWISSSEISSDAGFLYAGVPALAMLQCLLEAAASKPSDLEKNDTSGLEYLHLCGGVAVSWKSSSHPLCNHFFAAAAGCHDELVAMQPFADGELDCLSVLILTDDPTRAAALASGGAIGRMDAIAMRLRMLGRELSRLWQFRRNFRSAMEQHGLC